jgi:hypothetical protein
MKRNLDLVREILFVVEQQPMGDRAIALKPTQFTEKFPGTTADVLIEHIQLLVEQNFLEAEPHQLGWFITRLTWSGHDFLSNSKVKSVWEKAKHAAGNLSFGTFVAALNSAAITYSQMAINS